MKRLSAALLFQAGVCLAQPAIDLHGVVNAASYLPYGALNMGLAQGALITIFGNNLGPSQLVQASLYPLTPDLGGVTVQIKSDTVTVTALPVYVSARQIAAVVPSRTPLGPATVAVTYRGQTSAGEPVVIVKRAFGMFTLNQAGTGPAVVQNFESQASQPVNTLVESARPGQTVTLWGTGLGPVTGDEAAGPLPGNLAGTFAVYVGGVRVPYTYVGRSGCCAGIDQIVFQAPDVEGCYVPIAVVAGPEDFTTTAVPDEGTVSNTGTMSISSKGKICQDSLGFSGTELMALQSKGGGKIGAFTFLHDFNSGDSASGAFVQTDLLSLLRSNGIWGLPSAGSCIILSKPLVGLRFPDPTLQNRLDGGTLRLTGPKGGTALTQNADGSYSLPAADFLVPGNFTFTGSGGKDVGMFQTSFSVPPTLTWRFSEPTARSGQYSWQGGDPNGYVLIGVSDKNLAAFQHQLCVEPAGAGQATFTNQDWLGGVLTGGGFGRSLPSQSLHTLSMTRLNAPDLDAGFVFVLSGETR